MRKAISIIVLAVFVLTAGCGDTKRIGGTEYDTYGLINAKDNANPDIEYSVIWGNVFWGTFFFGTIIAPIYFFGFSMFEPERKKDKSKPIGAV